MLLSLKVTSPNDAMAQMVARGVRLIRGEHTERVRLALYHPKDT